MKIQHLEGLISAPFTPMSEEGKLNCAVIPSYYRMLKANGITGAFICGSTGEGVSLTLEEKMEVMDAWAEATKGDPDFAVIMFAGGTCLQDCITLAKYALELQFHSAALTAPFYFKPANVAALADCVVEVASAVPELPFYYYHIPVLTGVGITIYDLLQALNNRLENFAGVKYTHEDMMDFLSCRQGFGQRYDMLWGRDETMLGALATGAKAAVGSTFNYLAPLYQNLIKAFAEGDHTTAQDLQEQSIKFIRLLGKYGGIATGKAYMKKLGMDCGGFRLPVKNMTSTDFEAFSAEVDALGFSEYRSVVEN